MNISFLADARAEHTRRWAQYFARHGHRVDVITLNPDILSDYDPVRVHVARKPIGSSGTGALALNLIPVVTSIRRILRAAKPHVVHAHSAGAYAWLAMLSGFHPYLVTPWGTDILIDIKQSRLNHMATLRSLRRAALVTTDGYHVKDEMVRLGVPADKIEMLMFGTDVDRFSPGSDNGRHVGQSLDDDSPVVISTRTLTPIHDVATFIRALPEVKRAFPRVAFLLVGDGVERAGLERLARDLGVSENVRFVGRVEEDEMIAWLRAADVYVSPSLADAGLAASTAEAMACGLPVVLTDNADNKRWVNEGGGGFLVPAGAPEILAERITQLLKDEGMRLEFGRRNRQVIEQRNNYAVEMKRMEIIYKELAQSV